eukprot:Protomagalhaensia_sp_Gyna_25__5718@NODE_81_length_5430_cov_211_494342_g62_i0_p3_GENE_NODE_81_length_5430_cov_211_494342_g62_i0NODE_81_length_5430_cov_211_494342_g62_i0_p3_ORF_typecomplete_len270_score54_64TatD_DNase/PF01026_21/2_6e53Amidohydro_2/PF04909_14/0_0017_NODE_81_length_5430_cov_211_494342_g62_i030613870
MATGTSLRESKETINLIKAQAVKQTDGLRLYSTVGIHPTSSKEFLQYPSTDHVLEELKKLINENKDIVKAYGEFGLDRARTSWCDFHTQQKYFDAQLALAEYADLPLFLHCREAADVFYPILKKHPKVCEKGGVIHSFDGSVEEVKQGLELGLDFGLNGCSIRDVEAFPSVKAIPTDRIHFETDAPWCSIKGTHASMPLLKWSISRKSPQVRPEKYDAESYVKGRNEPSLIYEVAEAVFRIRNPDDDSFENFQKFAASVYQRSCQVYKL